MSDPIEERSPCADYALTVGSLFSGIGGVDMGLERAGMRVAWQCEVDPAARRVLARRWPDVPCYDDVSTLKGSDVSAVDVLCGGFPCQDLSVAGRRAGLAGERSGLFHEFMRLADEIAPRWVLIENVPGLLSSNDGADMGVVLDTLADLGYGWAYRVLDAQYFGVAQRRRRVFIVGCAGDARRAGEVLLELDCCDGNPAPSREAGTRAAPTLEAGANRTGGTRPPGSTVDTAESLVVAAYPIAVRGRAGEQEWELGEPDVHNALRAGGKAGDGSSSHNWIAYPLAMRGRDDGAELEMGEEGVYNALRAGDGGSSRQNLVMAFSENQRGEVLETPYSRQITTGGGKPGQGYPAVRDGMAVRRLMPVECERLQGFPDGWTDEETDSARYRLLGNAVCVPVAEWIGRRITLVHDAAFGESTVAHFDGYPATD